MGFIPESQGWFNIANQRNISINKIKYKNHTLILINADNHLKKLSIHLGLKNSQQNGDRRYTPQHNKGHIGQMHS